ncbi:MAG: hypothetical protein U0350_00010 [Caldilineaceae bacterium]
MSEPPEADLLNAQLAAPTIRPVTSAYVWMEYQRTVVADFAHVHRLMLQYSDWGGLLGHILDGERAFRPRSAVRCTKIIGKFYAECEQNWETAKYAIGEQIRVGLQQRFWRDILPLPDPIVCDLVTTGSVHQPDHTYAVAASCRKEQAACHLPVFLAEHQAKLRAVADHLATHPHTIKDQVRLERLLTAILADPRAALGQTSCWPLGDLIIALQVPTGAALWTLDADFSSLAAVLNISLYAV